MPGDLAAEDGGNLFGLPDRSVGIQQSLAELIQGGPPVKDQIIAIFHLGEEKPVLAAGFFEFAVFEEWSQAS